MYGNGLDLWSSYHCYLCSSIVLFVLEYLARKTT
jgi:hypothetical protein